MVSFDGGVSEQSRWRHSVTVRSKMADIRYYGNVMTTTRWRLYVTMETLSTTRWRLCVFYIFNSTVIDWTCYMFFFLCDTIRGWRRAFRPPVVSLQHQQFTAVPLQKAFTTGTPFPFHTTVIMTSPAAGTQLKFFFLQQYVPCHFNCWSDLGLKCWIQVQLAMTTCKSKFSHPLLKGYNTSLKIACLVFYLQLLVFVASNILEQSSTTIILKLNPSGNPWNGTAWHLQVRREKQGYKDCVTQLYGWQTTV